MDVLFINFDNYVKCGFTYEPSPAWQITGTLHSYGSIGLLDFIFSTAWCYNAMLMLDNYETPIEYISVLDSMDEVDRFNLLWCSMLSLIRSEHYHNLVPQNAQVDLTSQRVPVALPELKQSNQIISTVVPAALVEPEEKSIVHSLQHVEFNHSSSREPSVISSAHNVNTELTHRNTVRSTQRAPESTNSTNSTWKPMPVVTSNTLSSQKRNEGCYIQ
jgi:hypothetical protein